MRVKKVQANLGRVRQVIRQVRKPLAEKSDWYDGKSPAARIKLVFGIAGDCYVLRARIKTDVVQRDKLPYRGNSSDGFLIQQFDDAKIYIFLAWSRYMKVAQGKGLVSRPAVQDGKSKPPTLKATETARRQRVARQEAEKPTVKVAAGKLKEQVLLDLVMPNGTAMRYCTGTQMAGFGRAYQAIAERAGDAMVGEVMVESEIRALLLQATPT
jgi:hypothetical protein